MSILNNLFGTSPTNNNVGCYVSLQGIYKPAEYIEYAQFIEKQGFHRLYIFDDLFNYPSIPIVTLIAQHTHKIKIGSCLLNGFYRHPAIIASNAVFLQQLSKGRYILGLGRGAFYDFVNMRDDEEYTRKGYEETIQLVKQFLSGNKVEFNGDIFKSTEKAFLRVDSAEVPIITGTWNENMTYIAGKYSNELQIADVWEAGYLQLLESKFSAGRTDAANTQTKNISIGGICCISDDEKACREKVKHTLSIYLPYLTRILEKTNTPIDPDRLKQIEIFSKDGDYKKASALITDDMINTLTLTGSPEFAIEKINAGLKAAKANSILFSAPFGPDPDVKKNLKLIAQRVMPFLER